MKKVAILCLAVSLLSSGCGTTQPERTGAIVGGAVMAGEEATGVLPLEALSAHWPELLLGVR